MEERASIDPERLRKKRLLATFLLLILFVCGLADALWFVNYARLVIPRMAYAFLLAALVMNHLGRYREAALLTLTMFPLVSLDAVLRGGDPRLSFSNIIIGIIASSILLDRRGALLFDGACFGFLLLTPVLIPGHVPDYRTIQPTLILVAIGSGLSLLLMIHRDEVEHDRQASLRAGEERLRLALDAAHMGAWEWDADRGFARWSERARTLMGLPLNGEPGNSEEYFETIHTGDRTAVRKAFEEALSAHNTDFEVLHRVTWPDGTTRWIQVQGRSIGGPGPARRMNGAVLDVTDRKKADAERAALIEELEQKNAELERFTYTVSHDLKSPLITVRGFLGSIEKDVKDGRFDRLSVDVERILKATARMQRLLDELLNLSRIGRIANTPERLSFPDLAREAMAVVRGRLDAGRVRVEIREDLPSVFGDRSRLVQVLQNLFDNAAKFMGDQKNPRVVVGSRPSSSEGRPVFFVEDNGVGIEPAHLQKVLGLFEKLDAQTEGTGVGLAIVKRVVEVHGGKLWLESDGKGLGTRVCFTLPTRAPV